MPPARRRETVTQTPRRQELPQWASLTPAEVLLIFRKVLRGPLSVPWAERVKNPLGVAKAVSLAKPVCLEPRRGPGKKDHGEGGPGLGGRPPMPQPRSGSGSATDPWSLRGYSPRLTFQICEMEILISTPIASREGEGEGKATR